MEWLPEAHCYLNCKTSIMFKELNNIKEESTTNTVKISINLKFSGNTANRVVKHCIKKLSKCFKREVTIKFVFHYQTTKLCYFTNTKDKTPFLSQLLFVNVFVFPGCKSCYVGKTDSTLHDRTK